MKIFIAILLLGLSAGQVLAQGKVTVVETLDGQVVGVKQVDKPTPDAFNSFRESDKNGNGCIEPNEAELAGIMQFRQSDRNRNGCLDEQEYYDAN